MTEEQKELEVFRAIRSIAWGQELLFLSPSVRDYIVLTLLKAYKAIKAEDWYIKANNLITNDDLRYYLFKTGWLLCDGYNDTFHKDNDIIEIPNYLSVGYLIHKLKRFTGLDEDTMINQIFRMKNREEAI